MNAASEPAAFPPHVAEVLNETSAATPETAPPPAETKLPEEPSQGPTDEPDEAPEAAEAEVTGPALDDETATSDPELVVLLSEDWKGELAALGFDLEELEELDALDPLDELFGPIAYGDSVGFPFEPLL